MNRMNMNMKIQMRRIKIYSCTQIPKEISPTIEPNSVTIRGSYRGASVDILNKMIVQEIEVNSIIGLSSLIFFASAQAVTFQPLAVTIGFGLLWGKILNLFYLQIIYNFSHGYKKELIVKLYEG